MTVEAWPQRRVGRFELRDFLGRGATGDVHLAWDAEHEREVALKLVRLQGTDPEALEAERHGAELQRRVSLEAPQVAAVHEYGDLEGCFYVAMEHVVGQDLAHLLHDLGGRLEPRRAVSIARQLCDVLEVLHGFSTEIDGKTVTRIIHGDLKPENIRVEPGDRVRLLDFGVAKHLSLTRKATRNVFGTYPYTPPERLRSGLVNEASDLWAVGIVLYRMVSGQSPYAGESPEELERAILRHPPLPLPADCPAPLRGIVETCLAYESEWRYASADELSAALDEAASELAAERAEPAEDPEDPEDNDAAEETVPRAAGTTGSVRRDEASTPDGFPSGAEVPESERPTARVGRLASDDSTHRTIAPPPATPAARPRWAASQETHRTLAPAGDATRRTLAPQLAHASARPRHDPSPPAPPAFAPEAPPAPTRRTIPPPLPAVDRSLRGRMRTWARGLAKRHRRRLTMAAATLVLLETCSLGSGREVAADLAADANPDVWGAYQKYRTAAALIPFDLGLGSSRRALREALWESSERVIYAFREDTSAPRLTDWEDANRALGAAMDLGLRDDRTRARLYYTQGHVDRIEAKSLRDRDREEAGRRWNDAEFAFQQAAALDPAWPDPFLGLARVYAYERFDLERLLEALGGARARGMPWGRRELAQLADANLRFGSQLQAEAAEVGGERSEEQLLYDARTHLETSVDGYDQILSFGNARENRDEAMRRLEEIRERLRELRRW